MSMMVFYLMSNDSYSHSLCLIRTIVQYLMSHLKPRKIPGADPGGGGGAPGARPPKKYDFLA